MYSMIWWLEWIKFPLLAGTGLKWKCFEGLFIFPHQKRDRKSVWISSHFDLCVYVINYCLNLCDLLWSKTQLQSPRLWAQIILNQIFHNVIDVLNNTQQLIIITFFFCIILPCCNQFKYSSLHKPLSSPPQNAFQNTAANKQLLKKSQHHRVWFWQILNGDRKEVWGSFQRTARKRRRVHYKNIN